MDVQQSEIHGFRFTQVSGASLEFSKIHYLFILLVEVLMSFQTTAQAANSETKRGEGRKSQEAPKVLAAPQTAPIEYMGCDDSKNKELWRIAEGENKAPVSAKISFPPKKDQQGWFGFHAFKIPAMDVIPSVSLNIGSSDKLPQNSFYTCAPRITKPDQASRNILYSSEDDKQSALKDAEIRGHSQTQSRYGKAGPLLNGYIYDIESEVRIKVKSAAIGDTEIVCRKTHHGSDLTPEKVKDWSKFELFHLCSALKKEMGIVLQIGKPPQEAIDRARVVKNP